MANLSTIHQLQELLVVIFLLLAFSITQSKCWHLAQIGLNESYRVQHLSTYYSRVFLSISVESDRFPTLVESQWPASYLPLPAAIFPNLLAHSQWKFVSRPRHMPKIIFNDTIFQRDCSRLQKVIWTQVDGLNRLWVLDIGWSNGTEAMGNDVNGRTQNSCPPKLIAYDLLRNNVEVLRIDCSKYIPSNVTQVVTVKLGPHPTRCQVEKFVYFLLLDNPYIIAYDIIEQKWERRRLVSRKYENISDEKFPIKPIDIAFGKKPGHDLLISDRDGILYSSNNALLHYQGSSRKMTSNKNADPSKNSIFDDPSNGATCEHEKQLSSLSLSAASNGLIDGEAMDELEMDILGSLIGPSRGMMVDYTDALFYVVPKYGAVVRCEYKFNMTAEDNEIIYITPKNIRQIFFGIEDSVWLLTDRLLKPNDNCFAGMG